MKWGAERGVRKTFALAFAVKAMHVSGWIGFTAPGCDAARVARSQALHLLHSCLAPVIVYLT